MRTLAKAAILTRILKAVTVRARAYLRDPKKMQDLVTDAEERAALIGQTGTMAQQTLAYLGAFGRLGRAFVTRRYRKVPWGTLLGATAAVLYFVMPIDFIPDILVGMGLVDDAALIAFVATRIKGDLDNFTMWERAQRGGAVAQETAAIEGTARQIEPSRLVAPNAVMEDVYLETPQEVEVIPTLPDATIQEAADAVLEAVEEAEQEQAALAESEKAGKKAAKEAEKAAKEAAREAEKAAKKAAKAAKKAARE